MHCVDDYVRQSSSFTEDKWGVFYNNVDRVGFEPTTPYVSSTVIGMQGRYSTGLNYRPTLN
jgi:hypothetical protein